MRFRWQLAIFDDSFDNLMPIIEYLCLRKEGKVNWQPSLDDSGLFLEHEGKERMGVDWNLGILEIVVRQFEAALVRFQKNQKAIIRSGILGSERVPFLLLQPSSNEISVSLFFIDDEIASVFPIDGICGKGADLYTYVEENRNEIVNQRQESGINEFKSLPFPKGEFVVNLEKEVKIAKELLAIAQSES
ncbi:MAG TPA: hypothetical protein V6C84_29260 [Coleofasciculaceae cyanobacterium]|jgi:hypothetical protein